MDKKQQQQVAEDVAAKAIEEMVAGKNVFYPGKTIEIDGTRFRLTRILNRRRILLKAL